MTDLHQTVLGITRCQWTTHSIYKAESCFWETILYKYFIFVHSPGPLNEGIHSQVRGVCIKRHCRVVKLRERSHPGGWGVKINISPSLPQRALGAQSKGKVSFSLEKRMGGSHMEDQSFHSLWFLDCNELVLLCAGTIWPSLHCPLGTGV